MKPVMMSAIALAFSGLITFAQSAVAGCGSSTMAPVTSDGSLYRFRISSYCNVTSPAPVSSLKSTFYQYYDSNSSFNIHRSTQGSRQGNLTGFTVTMTETVHTDHGTLVIDQNVFLGDDNRNSFLISSRSSDVEGDGDTKYTKMVNHTVRLNGQQIYIEKEIQVKKPWFAPESMFINTVTENLESDMSDLQYLHLSLIN